MDIRNYYEQQIQDICTSHSVTLGIYQKDMDTERKHHQDAISAMKKDIKEAIKMVGGCEDKLMIFLKAMIIEV